MFLILMAAFSNAEPQWVDADVLNVRDTPQGPVVARLISNDRVDVIERNGGFAHVRHDWGDGWVASEFLSDERTPNDDILRSPNASTADSVRAADRMLVRYGTSQPDREYIAQRLHELGHDAKAAQVAVPPPVFVAVCDGTDLIVAGAFPHTGPFDAWEHSDSLSQRLSEVAIQRWYTEGSVNAARFPGAHLDSHAAVLRGEGDDEVVVLGACSDPGRLYLSQHSLRTPPTPQSPATLLTRASAALTAWGEVTHVQIQEVADVVHVQATLPDSCDDGNTSDYPGSCTPRSAQHIILADGTHISPTASPSIDHTLWVNVGDGEHGPVLLGTGASGVSTTLMVLYPTVSPVIEYSVDVSFGGC